MLRTTGGNGSASLIEVNSGASPSTTRILWVVSFSTNFPNANLTLFEHNQRFKFFLDVVHSTSKEDSLRRADAQATLDGAARWLRGQHDASNAWLDEPTAKLHDLSLSDRESAPRPFPTRTSSLKPPSSALWDKGDGPMSRGRSLNTVPQVRSAPLGRDMLKRRSNSEFGRWLFRAPSWS